MPISQALSMELSLVLASGGSPSRFAIDLLFILTAAALVAQIFKRLRLATIPGFLVAGFLAGPVFGLVQGGESVAQISQLATVILMFTIGLHLDPSSLRRGMAPILFLGAASTIASIVFLWPVGLLLGGGAATGLVIAMALSMSSTAIILRILQERREVDRIHGRMAIGISIVQDLLAVVILAAIPSIAMMGGMSAPSEGVAADSINALPTWIRALTTICFAAVGVAVLFVAGRYILPRVLQEVARGSSAELVLIVAAAVAIGSAIGAHAIGFSPEMGAFLAGFVLASSPFKHHLAGQLSPLRDLFMAIFFTAIGLQLDRGAIADGWPVILAGAALIIVVKAGVITLSAWAFGASASAAVLTGVYLAQAGEFSLVVLGGGKAANAVDAEALATTVAAVIVSLIVSPLLVEPAHRLARAAAGMRSAPWISRSALRERSPVEADPAATVQQHMRHVIIAGYGPVGRTLAERFVKLKVDVTVIELNPKTVKRQSSLGRSMVYGDVTNPEVLENAGVREAEAIILSIPDEDSAMKACPVIRTLNPTIFIAARANYLSRAMLLQDAGADHVIVEEMATAQAMEKEVMARIQSRHGRHAAEGQGARDLVQSEPARDAAAERSARVMDDRPSAPEPEAAGEAKPDA